MSGVIFNSAAPADARPKMVTITRQRHVELLMRSVARQSSLEIACQHHQELSHLLFVPPDVDRDAQPHQKKTDEKLREQSARCVS